MKQLSDYTVFPKTLIKEGAALGMNVFIHMPQNGWIIPFRKIGDMIGKEEIEFLSKVQNENLLILIEEKNKINQLRAQVMAEELNRGEINSPVVKENAKETLNTLNESANITQSMEGVGNLVQNLISLFKKSPSVAAYDETLKLAASKSSDPLISHHQQVSSIVVLMALTVGDFSPDDLSDLAAAGLVHDLGLADITKSFTDSHIKELKKVNSQEKVIYMRHIQFTLDRIKKEKISLSPGMQRIIELHHENWDGTGFKAYAGNKIYRPARLLRIADDLVCTIQDKNANLGFQEALKKLSAEGAIYDPDMMKLLSNS